MRRFWQLVLMIWSFADSGVYGVIKHMTDEPYSFDEYSYGRLPAPTTTTEASTTTEDRWKIFSRGRTTEQPYHRLLVTTTPRYDSSGNEKGHLRFNTVSPHDGDDEYEDVGNNAYWDDFSDLGEEDYPNSEEGRDEQVSLHLKTWWSGGL